MTITNILIEIKTSNENCKTILENNYLMTIANILIGVKTSNDNCKEYTKIFEYLIIIAKM